jgi:hypothetical protein
MEAIRITKKPKKGLITIKLPAELSNKELLEVIVLPVERSSAIKEAIDIKKLKGAVNLNMTVEEIEQECEKMRKEWNRGF